MKRIKNYRKLCSFCQYPDECPYFEMNLKCFNSRMYEMGLTDGHNGITNGHTIENVCLTVGTYNQGDNLSYEADGELFNITGQFFVDKYRFLHHIHTFEDGTETDIIVEYGKK